MDRAGRPHKRTRALIVGAVPPPYMGPTVATEVILNSKLTDDFAMRHVNTSDHRSLEKLAAIDLRNIALALWHYVLLFWHILTFWPRVVYMPLTQTTLGYLRDSGFILISKLFGRRVVCHLRGGNFRNWFDGARPLTQRYVRFVHRFVDGQIVLGETFRSLFDGIVPADRISVVPNGLDLESRSRPRDANRTCRVLFLSNLKREKGTLDTLHAAKILRDEGVDAKFVFAGAWSEPATRQHALDYVRDHALENVRFAGKVSGSNKTDLLYESDVFVLPTYYRSEGHPWVLVEAMAAGLPLVGTDHATLGEWIQPGVNGFLVNRQDPQALAGHIRRLASEPALRDAMGEKSRALYEQQLTAAALVRNLSESLHSACGNRKKEA